MSYDELLGWLDYFKRRPPGWRSDDRAWKIMQSNGSKGDGTKIFPALASIFRPSGDDPMSNFKGSLMFHKMLSAKGGDKLDL